MSTDMNRTSKSVRRFSELPGTGGSAKSGKRVERIEGEGESKNVGWLGQRP